jgi:hypothetical protein
MTANLQITHELPSFFEFLAHISRCGWQPSPQASYQCFWDVITGLLFQDRTRDAVVWFSWSNLYDRGTHVWSEVSTTNGLFNTVFKVCVFPLLNVVRNRTKIAPWSLPMILFVWSTVWCSLVIFRMSWLAPSSTLNSWSSWLWSRKSSPFPPARLTFFRWMKFVSRVTGVGQFGPICPRGKNLESHGSDFLVLKSFRKFCSHS